jgi:hypothetical protein
MCVKRIDTFDSNLLRSTMYPEISPRLCLRTELLGEYLGLRVSNIRLEKISLHNVKLHDLFSPPNVIWEISSKTMSWGEACES